jgi:hypothetical protein
VLHIQRLNLYHRRRTVQQRCPDDPAPVHRHLPERKGVGGPINAVIAGCFFSWFMMRNSNTRGDDFAVQGMFFGILFVLVRRRPGKSANLRDFGFLSAMAERVTR